MCDLDVFLGHKLSITEAKYLRWHDRPQRTEQGRSQSTRSCTTGQFSSVKFSSVTVTVTVRLQDCTARLLIVSVFAPKAVWIKCFCEGTTKAPFNSRSGISNLAYDFNSHSRNPQRVKLIRRFPLAILPSTTYTLSLRSIDNNGFSNSLLRSHGDHSSTTSSGSRFELLTTRMANGLLLNPVVTTALTTTFLLPIGVLSPVICIRAPWRPRISASPFRIVKPCVKRPLSLHLPRKYNSSAFSLYSNTMPLDSVSVPGNNTPIATWQTQWTTANEFWIPRSHVRPKLVQCTPRLLDRLPVFQNGYEVSTYQHPEIPCPCGCSIATWYPGGLTSSFSWIAKLWGEIPDRLDCCKRNSLDQTLLRQEESGSPIHCLWRDDGFQFCLIQHADDFQSLRCTEWCCRPVSWPSGTAHVL